MTSQILTLYDYIKSSAEKYPSGTSFEFIGKKTTYSEFVKQIDHAASALINIGVKEDDIICIAMPNTPQAITMVYAANKIGAVVNMIHPLSSQNEIKMFVNRVNARTILILDQFYNSLSEIESETSLENIIVANIGEALPTVKRIAYNLSQKKLVDESKVSSKYVSWKNFMGKGEDNAIFPAVSDRQDKMALILHSGGTTGKVKGVCLSNRQVNESALQMIKANPMLSHGDRFLSVMPIFHGNGLVIGIHAIQIVGGTCILIPRFTPKTYARDLLKNKCNYMSGVPALFERLINVDIMKKADLSFLKGVFSGADSLSTDVERRINAFLKEHNANITVRQGYGMTEGVVATTLNPVNEQREGSIGKPLDGVMVKIVKPNTDEELPTGEIGEIVFSSITNMMYYYNDPEETYLTKKLHSDGSIWIHSGDLGYVDEDGFFYFKGRIKRMIVTNGYNVFPNELENIIEGFDMIDRCCIIGVPHETGTDKIKAFIVLKDGYSKDESTRNMILDLCRKSIAKYALPKYIEFIDSMPTTKVGKVDYNALK